MSMKAGIFVFFIPFYSVLFCLFYPKCLEQYLAYSKPQISSVGKQFGRA